MMNTVGTIESVTLGILIHKYRNMWFVFGVREAVNGVFHEQFLSTLFSEKFCSLHYYYSRILKQNRNKWIFSF